MRKVRKFLFLGGAVIIVAVVGYLLLESGEEASTTPTGQVTRIVKVTRGDLNLSVSADGVVQPINKVEIKSKASGQIEQLNFVEGQSVQKGELLIVLDQTTAKNDYEQAKADLAVQEANAIQSENNHRRSTELFEKQLISEQEKDQINVDYVRAKSQLVKAKAVLSSAEERLRETRIIAPVTGIILTKNVELGQIISSGVSNVGGGTLLATIADMELVNVETNVDEVDIGKIKVGQSASVKADAHPDDTFRGEVIRISPLGRSQQNVTTFNVIVEVQNIGAKLKAGMSASVDLEILNKRGVLLVPNDALKDPRGEQGREMLARLQALQTPEGEKKPDSGKTNGDAKNDLASLSMDQLRQRMQNATDAERDRLRNEMRERFQKMSPEERQRMFANFAQQGGGGFGGGQVVIRGEGGGGGGMMMFGGGSSGPRQRRQAQVSGGDEVRNRVTMVKVGEEFVPKMVKAGPSNFDFTEVIEGLKEGDEIQITSISRAKVASQQMTDRIRSSQGVGGIGGGSMGGGGRR